MHNDVKINKNGIEYIKGEPYIRFSFSASELGTIQLTEKINTVAYVLKKSINEIEVVDIMLHPYAKFCDSNDGEWRLFTDDELGIEELLEESPWVKAMKQSDIDEFIKIIRNQPNFIPDNND